MKRYLWMQSAAVVIGALRVNYQTGFHHSKYSQKISKSRNKMDLDHLLTKFTKSIYMVWAIFEWKTHYYSVENIVS